MLHSHLLVYSVMSYRLLEGISLGLGNWPQRFQVSILFMIFNLRSAALSCTGLFLGLGTQSLMLGTMTSPPWPVVLAPFCSMCVVPHQSLIVTAVACCRYWNIELPAVLMLVWMLNFEVSTALKGACAESGDTGSAQWSQFVYQMLWNDDLDCWAEVQEQHPYDCSPLDVRGSGEERRGLYP